MARKRRLALLRAAEAADELAKSLLHGSDCEDVVQIVRDVTGGSVAEWAAKISATAARARLMASHVETTP